MCDISIIAAFSSNKVIGSKGEIPWNIPGEQSRFRVLTTGNVVIMGRKTFDEIFSKLKKPLPDRINIVISSTKDYSEYGCRTFQSLNAAIDFCKTEYAGKEIFIGGGEKLYQEAIRYADKMYLTEIDMKVDGDAFFPDFNETDFVKEINEIFTEPVSYRYVTYRRKN